MFKILKNNAPLYLVWLGIIACILIGAATTNVLYIVALLAFAVFSLFSNTISSCVLLFGLLPVAYVFKLDADSMSLFTVCEMIVFVISLFKGKKIKASFFFGLVFLALYLVLTDINNLDLLAIVKIVVGFYLIYLIGSEANKEDVINIAYILSTTTIITALLAMNNSYFSYIEPYFKNIDYLAASSGNVTRTMRMFGFMGDPNYFSVLVLTCISFLTTLFYYNKIKFEFLIFIGFLIPIGFFTYSKSYFLCVLALILFLIIFVLMPKRKGLAIAAIAIIALIAVMALSGRIEVINLILDRFSERDITTGRTSLNELYWSYIWNNPKTLFFGDGITADRITGAINNVHNVYIESIFKLGMVGSLLYAVVLFLSGSTGRKATKRRKIVNFFPMIFVLVLYFALAGITMFDFPFYISIAFLAKDFNLLEDGLPKE